VPRPLSINELAEKTFTHQSTVSEVVSRLVDKRLITRNASKLDGRRLELVLTPRGRATLGKAPKTAQEALAKGLDRMTERKRQKLALLLSELLRSSGFSTEEAPPLFFEESKKRKLRQ
jgi:DNA-binding MarR family transcriptional regulator